MNSMKHSKNARTMKKFFITTIVALLAFPAVLLAKEMPAGYYNNASGKTGEALLTALHNIIKSHTKLSYGDVLSFMKSKDLDANKHIYDMYSTAEYGPNDNGSSASNVGEGWNREHSFPNSWFGGSNSHKAYTDLFHLYPTDIRVNSQRSSFPFGECANGERLQNGNIVAKGKKGASTRSGFSGTVFEPDDEYKGDFARSYFYIATCYNDEIATWKNYNQASTMLKGDSYPVFNDWALQMLLEWHRKDPVSQKEINRNNDIHDKQSNRNPYIDYPELVEYVWGNMVGTNWTPGGTVNPNNPELNLPEDGSIVEMGSTTPGNELTAVVDVEGVDLLQDLSVSVAGDGFAVEPSIISVADAISGSEVYVTFTSTTPGNYTGTLTVASSEVSATVTLHAVVEGASIDTPVATDATNITATSFQANWGEVSGAQSYTLYVSKKGYVPPATYTLLLDEDMSDGKTTWTAGGKTYKDDGYFRLGTGSGIGSVTSPLVNLTTSNGITTVKITAKYYGNDSGTQMKVSVIDDSKAELDSKTFTLTASDAVYTAVLTGAASNTNRIMIENIVIGKRVQLKNVKVYAGDASAANAPVESGDENTRTITDITGTNYTVENLTENATYEYKVKAIGDNVQTGWSNIIEVALANQQWLQGDVNGDGKVNVSDVSALINMILGITPTDKTRADVNGDGRVNVSDVTALINIILGIS